MGEKAASPVVAEGNTVTELMEGVLKVKRCGNHSENINLLCKTIHDHTM